MKRKDVLGKARAGFLGPFSKALRLCIERGVEEATTGCSDFALAMLRPDLCQPEVIAQGTNQTKTGEQFIEAHGIEDYVRPVGSLPETPEGSDKLSEIGRWPE